MDKAIRYSILISFPREDFFKDCAGCPSRFSFFVWPLLADMILWGDFFVRVFSLFPNLFLMPLRIPLSVPSHSCVDLRRPRFFPPPPPKTVCPRPPFSDLDIVPYRSFPLVIPDIPSVNPYLRNVPQPSNPPRPLAKSLCSSCFPVSQESPLIGTVFPFPHKRSPRPFSLFISSQ